MYPCVSSPGLVFNSSQHGPSSDSFWNDGDGPSGPWHLWLLSYTVVFFANRGWSCKRLQLLGAHLVVSFLVPGCQRAWPPLLYTYCAGKGLQQSCQLYASRAPGAGVGGTEEALVTPGTAKSCQTSPRFWTKVLYQPNISVYQKVYHILYIKTAQGNLLKMCLLSL